MTTNLSDLERAVVEAAIAERKLHLRCLRGGPPFADIPKVAILEGERDAAVDALIDARAAADRVLAADEVTG